MLRCLELIPLLKSADSRRAVTAISWRFAGNEPFSFFAGRIRNCLPAACPWRFENPFSNPRYFEIPSRHSARTFPRSSRDRNLLLALFPLRPPAGTRGAGRTAKHARISGWAPPGLSAGKWERGSVCCARGRARTRGEEGTPALEP